MRFGKLHFLLAAATMTAGLLTGCSSDDSNASSSTDAGGSDASPVNDAGGNQDSAANLKDIVGTAQAAGTFNTLVALVGTAGLTSTLEGAGPFTVFAPTDTAFSAVPSFLTTELQTAPYKTELGLILKYHVLSGETKAAAILGQTLNPATLEGGKLSINGANNKVVINGTVNVTTPDVLASNGVIHVIDGVLLPTIVDTAANYDDGAGTKFSQLVAAVTSANLATTLSGPGPFTVFAPTDAAFDALKAQLGTDAYNAIVSDNTKLTKLLTYHVLTSQVFSKDITAGAVATDEGTSITLALTSADGGTGVSIADSTSTKANVVLADIPNSNGVIHVIDKVLVPADL